MNHNELQTRINQINDRICIATHRAGRNREEVMLLAATKMISPLLIQRGIELGLHHFGENRIQEAESKLKDNPLIRRSVTWHLIGHLQSNKARRAVELFDVIQTVDSGRLALQLNRMAAEMNRVVPIYIEVKTDPASAKAGISFAELFDLAKIIATCANLRLEGLMTVPPYFENVEEVRPFFKHLRTLRDRLNQQQLFNYDVTGLSMGMSHDYETAIEEGATIVRIGTAIWGPRPVL